MYVHYTSSASWDGVLLDLVNQVTSFGILYDTWNLAGIPSVIQDNNRQKLIQSTHKLSTKQCVFIWKVQVSGKMSKTIKSSTSIHAHYIANALQTIHRSIR